MRTLLKFSSVSGALFGLVVLAASAFAAEGGKDVTEKIVKVIEQPPTVVNSVIMSKSNVKYAISKKKIGKMGPNPAGGLLVKRVTPESLLENLALKAGDVVLEVNGGAISGRPGMSTLAKTAKEQATFNLTVLRGGKKILFKYQQ